MAWVFLGRGERAPSTWTRESGSKYPSRFRGGTLPQTFLMLRQRSGWRHCF